jgi:predicted regulator of Ras-like GTPase activity (Roadblock/LC7/MglB family)
MDVCKHGLARHPTYATGYVVMAAILIDAGMPEEAAENLRQALRLDPFHPRAHLQLGELLLSRGDSQGAAAEFEAALLCSPGLLEVQARLAEIRGEAPDRRPPMPPGRGPTGRKAGERPEWLAADRTSDLVSLATARPWVASAAVADADGRVVASSTPGRPSAAEAEAVAELVSDGRSLVSRLGAGRLRSVMIGGDHTHTLYLPLGDLVLLAELQPGSDADETLGRLEEAVDAGPGQSAGRGADD